MQLKRITIVFFILTILLLVCLRSSFAYFQQPSCVNIQVPGIDATNIINNLGWIQTNEGRCGGYYLESPFLFPKNMLNTNLIQITSNQYLFAQKGTSIGQGQVTITRYGQQIIANKAYIYRDPQTGQLRTIELVDEVRLREPNSLIVANRGIFNYQTKAESLEDILYRTVIYSDFQYRTPQLTYEQLQQARIIYQLNAWGQAKEFKQDQPKIYKFEEVSYSTCPPTCIAWQLKACHIELNKITGEGYATHARLLVRGVPVVYTPYLSFPIDSRRKTGFLWPTVGTNYGTFIKTPFYWNMAPNYDMTISPSFFAQRGVLVDDLFRYLTTTSKGNVDGQVIPHDRAFAHFKQDKQGQFQSSPSLVTQSNLSRLLRASPTRGAFNWVDTSHFNEHWSSNVDYNFVSDDYYLRDFSTSLNQVTQNQLLQQGEVNYQGQFWNFTGRVQAYQTLHPVDENTQFNNAYTRLPQLVLNGDFPDMPGGFEYFIDNEIVNFDISRNPGSLVLLPVGERLNVQPGISRPFNWPFLSVTPRLQLALTQYNIRNTNPNTPGTNFPILPHSPNRALPIFDINAIWYFDRDMIFLKGYQQTLEPQLYYTYIPYQNQNNIPIFDTTVNTLTFDQLFTWNRFSSIDRINDANQLAAGITSRFIEQETGTEKAKIAAGEIIYFRERKVTLCQDPTDPFCPNITPPDVPSNPNNFKTLSPLTASATYNVNPDWSATGNTIWNPQTGHVDNQNIGLHFQPTNTQKIINIGYNFVRQGDIFPGANPNSSASNLSQTDFSFNWPIFRDWSTLGRWTQNLNHHHFQNLLYGLQYDSCCWAVRLVAGKIFTNLGPNNTFVYKTQIFFQFALKGLGTIPVTGGDPTQLLSSNISGYQNNFGRDF